MNIEIHYRKKADKFLAKNHTLRKNEVDTLIIKAIRKIFKNENIDLKDL